MKSRILIAIIFLAVSGFYFSAQASSTQDTNGGLECRHVSGGDAVCTWNSIVIIDYNNFQGYELDVSVPFINVTRGTATLEVWACMSQSGIMWSGSCWKFYDTFWFDPGVYSLGTQSGSIGNDDTTRMASAGLLVRVVNINPAVTSITLKGRRVSIDSFNVPSSAVQGSSFTVSWLTDWADLRPGRVIFSFQAGISCDKSGPVAPDDSASCIGTQTGTFQLTLEATGPGGIFNTPITIQDAKSIIINPPQETCQDPNASNYGGPLPCVYNAPTCSPSSQDIAVGGTANFNATAGNGAYSWSAPGGSPSSGNGSSFSTSYSTTGTKTVTVTSAGQSDSCTVSVSTPPPLCGNGVVDSGEQCDTGVNNGSCPRTCSSVCTINSCSPPTPPPPTPPPPLPTPPLSNPRILTATVNGQGTLTSSPAGLNCGSNSTCVVSFQDNTFVTLTAAADSGWIISNWSGDCSGSSSTCNFIMSQDRTAIINFGVSSSTQTPTPGPNTFWAQGIVFNDQNQNTGYEAGIDFPLSGRIVNLLQDSDNNLLDSDTTDSGGNYFVSTTDGSRLRLTHQYNPGQEQAINDQSFTLKHPSDSDYSGPGTQYNFAIYIPIPQPTVSNISVAQPNYCVSGPAATTNWDYSDPSGSLQSAYQVQIDDQGSFNSPEWDSGKVLSSGTSNSTPQGILQFNTTYKARVRVWNSSNVVSSWAESKTWKTPNFAYPQVNFTFQPSSPQLTQSVQFTDQTVFYDNNPNGRRWNWNFGDSNTSTQQNPQHSYVNAGVYNATLTATDNANQSCSLTKPVNVRLPNPIWKEVNPGG